jgi:hypothetical protein
MPYDNVNTTVRKHRITFSTRPGDTTDLNIARGLILYALLMLDDEEADANTAIVMLEEAADKLCNLSAEGEA